MQRFLISTVQQELEDIRDMFLTHHEICVPHKENGCWYGDVMENIYDPTSGKEWMLCVTTEAEQYLSTSELSLLLDDIPDNFTDTDLI